MNLELLNSCAQVSAESEFLRCCGSSSWAKAMAGGRPYASLAELSDKASIVWNQLAQQDWLEAFSAHPRIGTSKPTTSWSKVEQAGMSDADSGTRSRIAFLNDQYFNKFGFVFLICATGKSASEMLRQLEVRLGHTREQEIMIAKAEQDKITKIRLEKLLCTD